MQKLRSSGSQCLKIPGVICVLFISSQYKVVFSTVTSERSENCGTSFSFSYILAHLVQLGLKARRKTESLYSESVTVVPLGKF